jgi:hypothetical protein
MIYRKERSNSRRAIVIGTIFTGLLALLLSACGQPEDQSAISPEPSAAVENTTASADDDGLTGFGATVEAWNANHTADSDFDPGSVYDPDPSLPSLNGHTGATYVEVNPQDDRVVSYDIHTTGLSESAAVARALQELPSDASKLWGVNKGTCYQAELASDSLGQALPADLGDPDGEVFAEITTLAQDGTTAAYDSGNLDQIELSIADYPNAAAAGDC